MVSKQILLPTLDSVKKFVNITNRYDFLIELISDKYRIDAKSIMGILSLDRSKPLLLKLRDLVTAAKLCSRILPYSLVLTSFRKM